MANHRSRPEKALNQSVAPSHKTLNIFTKGNIMNIYRNNALPGIYVELPFIRVSNGGFVDSTADIGLIRFFRECAEGKRCISELNSENLIVVKVDVPFKVINNKERSGEIIEWFFYFWKPGDKTHVSEPGKRRPFEAVDLESAGINVDYLFSIADGLIGRGDRKVPGRFSV